jgi:pimeloyl-ACP methyl ester carboxylesterase
MHDPLPPTSVRGVTVCTSNVRLADGRDLAFSEFGDIGSANVLVYCHSGGSCRFEASGGHRIALARGIRIVAMDRPGYGRSSPHSGRSFDTGARDLAHLVDALQIDRYVVAGFSAGAPYALATLLRDPSRARAAVLINTAGDRQHPLWQRQSAAVRFVFWMMSHKPVWTLGWQQTLRRLASKAKRGDEHAAWLLTLLGEGCRQGTEAVDAEIALCYQQGWGLDWTRASRPVLVLHGKKDPNLPFVRALEQDVEQVSVEEIPGGHMDALTSETWNRLCLATSRHCAVVEPSASSNPLLGS